MTDNRPDWNKYLQNVRSYKESYSKSVDELLEHFTNIIGDKDRREDFRRAINEVLTNGYHFERCIALPPNEWGKDIHLNTYRDKDGVTYLLYFTNRDNNEETDTLRKEVYRLPKEAEFHTPEVKD